MASRHRDPDCLCCMESQLREVSAAMSAIPKVAVEDTYNSTSVLISSVEHMKHMKRSLSATAIAISRKKIKKYLNTNTTVRIYRLGIAAEAFQFGANESTIIAQNQTEPLPTIGPRCAVVGNSGILENSRCGSEIDEHDFIFRLNLAPVGRNFSSDVGSRISLTTVNRAELLELSKIKVPSDLLRNNKGLPYAERTFSITNKTIVWYPKGNPQKLRTVASLFNRTLNLQPLWAYSPESLMYLASRIWKIPLPSTGLSVVTVALLHCDEVNIYGFYPFPQDSRNRELRYHYYEPTIRNFYSKNGTVGVHKMPREFALLRKLDEEGVLRLVNERCYDENVE
ncbi:CMP-N-acetylneuraminate-poly-alpha-2,8-sialyltransferase-like [Diadema setosum]|uniref:CMP-N-acetylneuraminate-poly-alpha-2, 8-sialyltransferase-like n=1 Tax=Diadema setosum TaxID=31175 RepID=UPI003B3AF1BB